MATAEGDFNSQCWNEVCEDVDCDDTNYHATVEELMQRIAHTSADIAIVDEAEDIVLQAELKTNEEE